MHQDMGNIFLVFFSPYIYYRYLVIKFKNAYSTRPIICKLQNAGDLPCKLSMQDEGHREATLRNLDV